MKTGKIILIILAAIIAIYLIYQLVKRNRVKKSTPSRTITMTVADPSDATLKVV